MGRFTLSVIFLMLVGGTGFALPDWINIYDFYGSPSSGYLLQPLRTLTLTMLVACLDPCPTAGLVHPQPLFFTNHIVPCNLEALSCSMALINIFLVARAAAHLLQARRTMTLAMLVPCLDPCPTAGLVHPQPHFKVETAFLR